MNRPFASACEENKEVILAAIKPYLRGEVLEIGSGTGQHAVYFAAEIPDLIWQTSDRADYLAGIETWIESSGLNCLPAPLLLDVLGDWPARHYDMIFSANSFHIMDRSMVEHCIAGVGSCLRQGGVFAVYGPFNYEGSYTSSSNERFDQYLRAQDPASGIKDFEWLDDLANKAELTLLKDVEMPANNRTIVWQKRTL